MSISLTRSAVETFANDASVHTWPLRVTCVSTDPAVPNEIFVYHAAQNDDPLVGDIFECVASVHQLQDIGLAPIYEDGLTVPYYRSDSLEFHCRSATEAEELWVKIQADALDLLRNAQALAALAAIETVELE